MIDRYVVGGFYRVHAERGVDENLNAPGAHFVPLAFAQQHALPDPQAKPGTAAPNRFYVYGVVARLALLAASLELEQTDPESGSSYVYDGHAMKIAFLADPLVAAFKIYKDTTFAMMREAARRGHELYAFEPARHGARGRARGRQRRAHHADRRRRRLVPRRAAGGDAR